MLGWGSRGCTSIATAWLCPHLFDGVEQVLSQPGIADGSAIPFNVGVLLWLARLNVLDSDSFPPRQANSVPLMYSGP